MNKAKLLAVATMVAPLLLAACEAPPTGGSFEQQDQAAKAPSTSTALRAGLRASHYGIQPFPAPSWWVSSVKSMSSRFSGAVGEQIAVAVEVWGGGGRGRCWARFPNPAPQRTWTDVLFADVDLYESTFTAFDAAGIKVWLQVEPAGCDVPMLIDLVMLKYGRHPSVMGFGVDTEWYRKDLARNGKPISDAEAQAWVTKTRSYNSTYQVFLKHWIPGNMPPTARTGLVFIDDSQGLPSLDALVNEFSTWGKAFAPSPVGFQFGYKGDQAWWSTLADPPGDIGRAILAKIPNTRDLAWVDFTATTIWPTP
jgi:hypothetical protein